MSYFKAKMHQIKFDFGWGSAPDPAGGAHSAPPGPLLHSRGSYFYGKGREWEGRKGIGIKGKKRKKRERKGREKGREGEGREGEGCVMAFGGMDAPGPSCSYLNPVLHRSLLTFAICTTFIRAM